MVMNNIVCLEGNVKIVMLIMIIFVILNMILNLIFIMGFGMGVCGFVFVIVIV